MKAALIVKVEIIDPGELPDLAEAIHDELEAAGINVISVDPWQREGDIDTAAPLSGNSILQGGGLLGGQQDPTGGL